MYISQKNYNITDRKSEEKQNYKLVVVLPSEPDQNMRRFKELIEACVNEITSAQWEIILLNHMDANRTPEKNYISIYYADAIVVECSDKKPNVFYMLGLAHASGRPVCACYKAKKNVEIPFNVHGRQSMTYAINDIESQDVFKKNLKEWLKNYEYE